MPIKVYSRSRNYVTSLNRHIENLGKFVMGFCGFYLALWARLIEIGVRTTSCTFAVICTQLCEELGEQMEDILMKNDKLKKRDCLNEEMEDKQIAESDIKNEEIITNPKELENWKNNYEIIYTFIENVSSSFGFLLFMFIFHDFAIAIFKFSDVLVSDDKVSRVSAFSHQLFRVFILLAASNQVNIKVRRLFSLFTSDKL